MPWAGAAVKPRARMRDPRFLPDDAGRARPGATAAQAVSVGTIFVQTFRARLS
jgi:hypothetical protein